MHRQKKKQIYFATNLKLQMNSQKEVDKFIPHNGRWSMFMFNGKETSKIEIKMKMIWTEIVDFSHLAPGAPLINYSFNKYRVYKNPSILFFLHIL